MKIRASVAKKKIHIDPLIYALYKGETYLMSGTMKEISDVTDTSLETLYCYLYESYRKKARTRKNGGSKARAVVCLGFDDMNEADERFLDNKYIIAARRSAWQWEEV